MKTFENIEEVIVFAMGQEQKAVDFYTELAASARNVEMRKTFEEIAREEIGHKAKLSKIKEEGIFNLKTEKIPDLKIADYSDNIEATAGMTYDEVLKVAMNREKGAFKLYTKLAENASNQQLADIFRFLAQEESKHKLKFELEYDEFVLREN